MSEQSKVQEAFLRLAAEARARIRQVTPTEVAALAAAGNRPLLVDVREADEFAEAHVAGAVHLSRGILEQRIEEIAPDLDAAIACYCAGGNRGALAADSLRQLGYRNVASVAGGLKAWIAAGLPTESIGAEAGNGTRGETVNR